MLHCLKNPEGSVGGNVPNLEALIAFHKRICPGIADSKVAHWPSATYKSYPGCRYIYIYTYRQIQTYEYIEIHEQVTHKALRRGKTNKDIDVCKYILHTYLDK